MPLPALENWETTKISLHHAAQVLSAIRKHLIERQPNHLHLSLQVVPEGVTTGKTSGGELTLNFKQQAVVYQPNSGTVKSTTLAGLHQGTLTDAVVALLNQAGHPVEPDRSQLTDTVPFNIDSTLASDYAEALSLIDGAVKKFWDGLPGKKSPPVVWGHGFDLSSLWFATDQADEAAPHMNFGFSPGSAGLSRPYFYSYAYPRPEGYTNLPLPPKTRWNTEGWVGTVMNYDDIRQESDPASMISSSFQHIYETVSPLLK